MNPKSDQPPYVELNIASDSFYVGVLKVYGWVLVEEPKLAKPRWRVQFTRLAMTQQTGKPGKLHQPTRPSIPVCWLLVHG